MSAEIGLFGGTSIEDGVRINILEADGTTRHEGNLRTLPVYYAWQRRASERGPKFGQGGLISNRPQLDLSAAQRIVERMIPDAFTVKDRAAGEPYVVLSAKGEVIAAGRAEARPEGQQA